jgi:hypothetical protein
MLLDKEPFLDREREILRLLAILPSTRQSKTVSNEGKVSKSTVLGQWFRQVLLREDRHYYETQGLRDHIHVRGYCAECLKKMNE